MTCPILAERPFESKRSWLPAARWDYPQLGIWSQAKLGTEADLIRNFYKYRNSMPKDPLVDISQYALSTESHGLGDMMQITGLPRISTMQGGYTHIVAQEDRKLLLNVLLKYNPYYKPYDGRQFLCMGEIENNLNCGNGQHTQRMARAFGWQPELKPKGCLVVPGAVKVPGRCAIHLEPSVGCTEGQRSDIHHRAREVYPENIQIIKEFIRHHPEMEFYEIACRTRTLPEIGDWTNAKLETSIERIATCEWFLCVISGPLHVAAALDVKTVCIINFPHADQIFLPTLKDISQVEAEWFPPQNVYLHQDNEGPLVRGFSLYNLERAFAGELYPYWKDDWLSLIYESC